MNSQRQYFAKTGLVTISTANSNLDGTGTLGTLITGATTGTQVDMIIIKAQGNTTEGMIRLFVNDGSSTSLYQEIPVPANVQTSVQKAFEIAVPINVFLNNGYSLKVSTENAETFNVIANGTTWNECGCSPSASCNELQKYANTGIVNISTANSNLDGTGSLGTVISATTGTNNGGTMIERVNIKATASTSQGMVRLFINNGTTSFLVSEVPVPANSQTGIQPALRTETFLGIYLEPGFSLMASTQNSESFNVMVDGLDIINCPCA